MTLKDELTSTPEGNRIWHQERVILETTELLCDLMHGARVSRAEMALRLRKTEAYVDQFLDGTINMNLREVSDFFTALDCEFHPRAT